MPSEDEGTIPNDHPSGRPLLDDLTPRGITLSVDELVQACEEAEDDLSLIADLASSAGGLQDDRVRRVACMSGIWDRGPTPLSDTTYRANPPGLQCHPKQGNAGLGPATETQG